MSKPQQETKDSNDDIEEKKRKINKLKERRMQINNQLKTDPFTIQNPIIQQAMNQLKPEEKPTQVKDTKQTQPQTENVVNQQPAEKEQKKPRELKIQSYIGEWKISPEEKVKFDIEIECNLLEEANQNQAQTRNSSSTKKVSASHDNPEEKGNNDSLPSKHQWKSEVKPTENQTTDSSKQKLQELTNEEYNQTVKSLHFQEFFSKSSKMIEVALQQQDINTLELVIDQQIDNKNEQKEGEILTEVMKLYDTQYSSQRVVTVLQWNKNLPGYFLAAYSSKDEDQMDINDYSGEILIWNMQLKHRPEFSCFCQSQVTSACFHPFQTSLVLGGLYNGQIAIWDMRAKSAPVQRTPLTQDGHNYPIYALDVVGTENANNIVSISNDGKLCLWNMAMLQNPTRSAKLHQIGLNNKQTELNVTSMKFKQGDANNFYVGVESGSMVSLQLQQVLLDKNYTNTNKEQQIVETFEGHEAPITSLSVNTDQQENSPLLQGLVLTSSLDWTVKLWNPKQTKKCIWSFETFEDYVYDVSWNPGNAALFAACDNNGFIDLYDLTHDFEIPLLHFETGKFALNKIQWNNDGSKILAGDSQGYVHCYSLAKKYQRYNPSKLQDIQEILEGSKIL